MLIDKIIEKAKNDPGNAKNLQIMIKIVRQVFNAQDKDKEETDGPKKDKKGKPVKESS